MPALNRRAFQNLAKTRISEAKTLLEAGHYDGAYYLAGYALECAFKACIARQTKIHDFPDKERVNNSHTHKLENLCRLAGLSASFAALSAGSRAFARNWAVAKDWDVESRYGSHSASEAESLVKAIGQRGSGVLSCIKQYW